MAALFIIGCADKIVRNEVSAPPKTPGQVFLTTPSSDADQVRDALSHLNSTVRGEQDYHSAKADLKSFVQKYPESKWRSCAQDLIQTMDTLLVLKNRVEMEKQLRERVYAERLKLFRDNEVLQEESARYQQENERLKSDIALLKQLEIQLEKRGKMLK
jgi:outer membrane protein assembly factor BamD (BamD/ComL family)